MAVSTTKRCLLCNAIKNEGLNILGSFICLNCEQEIISISLEEKKYQILLQKIKKLWKELDDDSIQNSEQEEAEKGTSLYGSKKIP